jgi:hypothetical protein
VQESATGAVQWEPLSVELWAALLGMGWQWVSQSGAPLSEPGWQEWASLAPGWQE